MTKNTQQIESTEEQRKNNNNQDFKRKSDQIDNDNSSVKASKAEVSSEKPYVHTTNSLDLGYEVRADRASNFSQSEFSLELVLPPPQNANDATNYVETLLTQPTANVIEALLMPTSWDKNHTYLSFYLASEEYFVERVRKILAPKYTAIVNSIMALEHGGTKKNVLLNYLQLKTHLPNHRAAISHLPCDILFARLQRILASKITKAINWLFEGGNNSIFYRFSEAFWYELQNNEQLKHQWDKTFTEIIKSNGDNHLKIQFISAIIKLPLNKSWIQLLLDHSDIHNQWLINFLEQFVSERKNAYLACLESIEWKEKDNYLIYLSNTDIFHIHELLTAYNSRCFALTSLVLPSQGVLSQISQVKKTDCAILKKELGFSLSQQSSLITHREILKSIFSFFGKSNLSSLPPDIVKFFCNMKPVIRSLNVIYKNIFNIEFGKDSIVLNFLNTQACIFLVQKLGLALAPSVKNEVFQPHISKRTIQIREQLSEHDSFLRYVLIKIAQANKKEKFITISQSSETFKTINKQFQGCFQINPKTPHIEIVDWSICDKVLEIFNIKYDSATAQNNPFFILENPNVSNASLVSNKSTTAPISVATASNSNANQILNWPQCKELLKRLNIEHTPVIAPKNPEKKTTSNILPDRARFSNFKTLTPKPNNQAKKSKMTQEDFNPQTTIIIPDDTCPPTKEKLQTENQPIPSITRDNFFTSKGMEKSQENIFSGIDEHTGVIDMNALGIQETIASISTASNNPDLPEDTISTTFDML